MPSQALDATLGDRLLAKELGHLALAAGLTVLVCFLLWEGIEVGFAHTDELAHRIHFLRGTSTSIFAAAVIALMVRAQHRRRAALLHEQLEARTRDAQMARQSFEAVVEHTPAGMLIIDREFRVLYANKTARRLHGGVEMAGQYCYASVAHRDTPCTGCPAEGTRQTRAPNIAQGCRTDAATGEVVAEEFYPLNLPGDGDHVLVVERIVTEQHKLQATLLHQEKMAAFGLLAAGIAHDMGNPLSAIEMHLQLLADESLPDPAKESVSTVRREVGRLTRTLRDLVNFARRRGAETSLVSLYGVVGDALRLLRYDRRVRNIEVRIDADAETPPVAMVEDHLMQVVLNLLINAVDAMPDGGELVIDIAPIREGVSLRIRDTGTGMSRDVLARACEPLFTTKAPGKGTGLGLSMCKDIVESNGGRLELHSTLGRGTTVVVTLPPARELDAAAEPASHPEAPGPRKGRTSLNVLGP